MKVTCNTLHATSGPPKTEVTLEGIETVQAETPDEIKVVVETIGWASLLEWIGKEKTMKHFGLMETDTGQGLYLSDLVGILQGMYEGEKEPFITSVHIDKDEVLNVRVLKQK